MEDSRGHLRHQEVHKHKKNNNSPCDRFPSSWYPRFARLRSRIDFNTSFVARICDCSWKTQTLRSGRDTDPAANQMGSCGVMYTRTAHTPTLEHTHPYLRRVNIEAARRGR
jgi:hypothetical protein